MTDLAEVQVTGHVHECIVLSIVGQDVDQSYTGNRGR